jgi:hypothetical protein
MLWDRGNVEKHVFPWQGHGLAEVEFCVVRQAGLRVCGSGILFPDGELPSDQVGQTLRRAIGDDNLMARLLLGVNRPLLSRFGFCIQMETWLPEDLQAYIRSRLQEVAIHTDLLKARILAVPSLLAANFHASLLPAYRGKEIDDATFEANAQTIFDEAENRLHVQKSVLCWLVS